MKQKLASEIETINEKKNVKILMERLIFFM